MKIHILFPITNEPHGGGNQFLRALRDQLRAWDAYAEDAASSDVILFNSYPFDQAASAYRQVIRFKRDVRRRKVVIHRVDGPIAVVRGTAYDTWVDRSIVMFNQMLSDATVFQSEWSRQACAAIGLGRGQPCLTIPNAADSQSFFGEQASHDHQARIRIVATSWSANWRKGFGVYRFVDRHLDVQRYQMTFIGNSPVAFTNTRKLNPLPSPDLGNALRASDLYLTASADDPCSNALIEAQACGLPAVARRSGGHPELVGGGGVLFDGTHDVLAAIDQCATNLSRYRAAIHRPSMQDVARRYVDFAEQVWQSSNSDCVPVHPAPSLAKQLRLWESTVLQARGPRLARRISRVVGVRESRLQGAVSLMRSATWEPSVAGRWNSADARGWLDGVLLRLPLFLDSLRHPKGPHLYRYSLTGDRQALPTLAASGFVAQIRFIAGLLDGDERAALAQHVCSYQRQDGAITDPWVARHSRLHRLMVAARTRSTGNLRNEATVRAETRQAFAALRCLDDRPPVRFEKIPNSPREIDAILNRLDWTRPWDAASQISDLAFFMTHHKLWFRASDQCGMIAGEMLNRVEALYRQGNGAWFARGARVSLSNQLNGAMKMLTALDIAGVEALPNPEGLVDLCLSIVNAGHACDHFDVVCVLYHCHRKTTYRSDEIRAYCLDRLAHYHEHYWPWQGGFSFDARGANDSYYGARVTTGAAEPDVRGTVVLLQSIVLIADILGWSSDLGLNRPIT